MLLARLAGCGLTVVTNNQLSLLRLLRLLGLPLDEYCAAADLRDFASQTPGLAANEADVVRLLEQMERDGLIALEPGEPETLRGARLAEAGERALTAEDRKRFGE